MSPNKTLYIRDDDMPTWEQAEAAAKSTSQSVSQLVTSALRYYLPSVRLPQQQTVGQITVELGEPPVPSAFMGRWLVEPDRDETRGGSDAGAFWGVALTRRNRIAVYMAHVNDRFPPSLEDFENLDEAVEDGLPEDLAAQAAAVLGQTRLVWRDI